LSATLQYYRSLGSHRREFAASIPVLMYHKIARPPAASRLKGTYVFPDRFAAQMRELARAGFQSAPMSDVFSNGNPQKKIVITFDDGFRNVLENAAPILRENNFRAIQFIIHDLMGATNRWDPAEPQEPLMTKGEVTEWLRAGHEIGSHTLTHPDLTTLAPAQLRREIVDSKKALEDAFGVSIRHFCYPFGKLNPQVAGVVQEAGYETGCTIQFGFASSATNRFEIPRLLVCHHRYGSQNAGVRLARKIVKAIGGGR
jgi:peptidoglycan/xylan/chitin deacetylase (PgdA/CDA1 family)